MEGCLGLLGTGGGGGGPSSGASTTGSMSAVSKEDNLVLFSEVSSSYPDESELELDLGLSFGGGGAAVKAKAPPTPTPWGQYARILTAKDLPSLVAKASSSSSSSSSSSVTKANNASAGTKRTADSVASVANGGVSSQVVGWPPIRSYRMNSLVNQIKSPPTEEFNSTIEKSRSKNDVVDKTNNGSNKNINIAKEKGQIKTSLFVKVNMDGIPIGRKVDLNAHSCYETLAEKLGDMFCRPTAAFSARRSSFEEYDPMVEATAPSKLLDGSSEFVLTYEDREGDWMLVGDVPWEMFLSSVKKLRIMRTSEVNGLAPNFQEQNASQRRKPI